MRDDFIEQVKANGLPKFKNEEEGDLELKARPDRRFDDRRRSFAMGVLWSFSYEQLEKQSEFAGWKLGQIPGQFLLFAHNGRSQAILFKGKVSRNESFSIEPRPGWQTFGLSEEVANKVIQVTTMFWILEVCNKATPATSLLLLPHAVCRADLWNSLHGTLMASLPHGAQLDRGNANAVQCFPFIRRFCHCACSGNSWRWL